MTEKTYTVRVHWDTGITAGQFVQDGRTEAQVQEIKDQLRQDAPPGSTHTVKVEAE